MRQKEKNALVVLALVLVLISFTMDFWPYGFISLSLLLIVCWI